MGKVRITAPKTQKDVGPAVKKNAKVQFYTYHVEDYGKTSPGGFLKNAAVRFFKKKSGTAATSIFRPFLKFWDGNYLALSLEAKNNS